MTESDRGPRYVIGLGNPGSAYDGTRHNIGFEVLDRLASRFGLRFEEQRGPTLVANGLGATEPFVLVKPLGFMNRSGEAFSAFLDGSTTDPERMLVVLDDLALPLGRLRLRMSGSDGGHNGLASLLRLRGADDLPRLRIGIGSVPASSWREHVLAPFAAEDRERIEDALDRALGAAQGFLDGQALVDLAATVNTVSPPE